MKISVVCPFYNEESIIENAANNMLENLKKSDLNWELIAVNDGSTDNGLEIIRRVFEKEPRAKIISYPYNQGRGYALKKGIDEAAGDIIVTTEIDLSWGSGIVGDIVNKFVEEPYLDVVIASPHLPGGGFKNVPLKRILLSKIGNMIIRSLFTKRITMNTGMTRGYKREVIQSLRTEEKGKEFHLEVLLKLVILGYKISEIPAILAWQDRQLTKKTNLKRKSSLKITETIFSHLNFAVFANPIRYFWALSLVCFLVSLSFIINALYRLATNQVSAFVALTGLILAMFGLIFFGFGIVTSQNIMILKELWEKDYKNSKNDKRETKNN